ncbi:hotdog fold thioesterase [Aliiroseovarius sp. PTFE2010]|uniref:hotdog fold thioesterase n=1 Tax=Aliiroseovarius sp. PTFE2010 TaxID=3417190 RepID=UPI003CEB09D9
MTIWKKPFTVDEINTESTGLAQDVLGIRVTDFGDDYIAATMPVEKRTHQPMGLLHGGASALLAETVGSVAANLAAPPGHICVGQEINANHLRGVSKGTVTGTARPLHIGRRSQVWNIDITDDSGRLICVSRLTMAVLDRSS